MTGKATLKNHRSLDQIADEIHRLERNSVFEVGELLIEAKETHPGKFLDWLDRHGWTKDSAARGMNVARLGNRFRNLRSLRLGKTTFYALTEVEESLLPDIIAALVKAGADKKQLKPREANDVIFLVQLRREWGDLPEATLRALFLYAQPGAEARDEIAAALKQEKPTCDDTAGNIVAEIIATSIKAQKASDVETVTTSVDTEAHKPPAQKAKPSPKSQQAALKEKLATCKCEIALLKAENKALETENDRLRAENAKLKNEIDKLKSATKNATEIAVRATGGTVRESASTKEAAGVSEFVHRQWGHVTGDAAPIAATEGDDGLTLPDALRRNKNGGAS